MVMLNSNIDAITKLNNITSNSLGKLHHTTFNLIPTNNLELQSNKRKAYIESHVVNSKQKIFCPNKLGYNLQLNKIHTNNPNSSTNGSILNHKNQTEFLKSYTDQSHGTLVAQNLKSSPVSLYPNMLSIPANLNISENKVVHLNQNKLPLHTFNYILNGKSALQLSNIDHAKPTSLQSSVIPNQFILVQTSIGPTLVHISQVKNKLNSTSTTIPISIDIQNKFENNDALKNLTLLSSLQNINSQNCYDTTKFTNQFASSLTNHYHPVRCSNMPRLPNKNFLQSLSLNKNYKDIKLESIKVDNAIEGKINHLTCNTPSPNFSNVHINHQNKPNHFQISLKQFNKFSRFAKQLHLDQKHVLKPKIEKFGDEKAISHLLPYHLFYNDNYKLPDANGTIYFEIFNTINHKKTAMFQKYQKLFWNNSMRKNNTLEEILLNRLWLTSERECLSNERYICKTQGPSKYLEYLELHYSSPQHLNNLCPDHSNPDSKDLNKLDILDNVINDPILDNEYLLKKKIWQDNGYYDSNGLSPDSVTAPRIPSKMVPEYSDEQTKAAINSILTLGEINNSPDVIVDQVPLAINLTNDNLTDLNTQDRLPLIKEPCLDNNDTYEEINLAKTSSCIQPAATNDFPPVIIDDLFGQEVFTTFQSSDSALEEAVNSILF